MNIKSFLDKEKKIIHKGPVVDSVERFDVIDCSLCKFKHVAPLPPTKELHALYKKSFYSTEKSNYFESVEKDWSWWMDTYRSYYRLFEKYSKGKKLLDIGSGPGVFLKCGKEMGWDVLGVEPSPLAHKYSSAMRLNVINDFFPNDRVRAKGPFDVVYMNMLLEHVRDPIVVIKNSRAVLKKGGLLCVVAPNEYNPLQKILKEGLGFSAWWIAPPQHLNYFDFKSMGKLLKKNGFDVLENWGTFPMEAFLLSGENYVGNDAVGKKCHKKRIEFERAMYKHGEETLVAFYKFLANHNIGRDLLILGRKK